MIALTSKAMMVFLCLIISIFVRVNPSYASETDGVIDTTSHYAYMEIGSWLDFGRTQGNVHVTDSALSGYAWSPELGWISLNCANNNTCGDVNYKVTNNSEGVLSGYAYGEITGWINFAPIYGGVVIDQNGVFTGYAYGDEVGWIVFNCLTTSSCATVSYAVKTDWRPESSRSSAVSNIVSSSGSFRRYILPIIEQNANIIDTVKNILPDWLKKGSVTTPSLPSVEKSVTKQAPIALSGKWQLIPSTAISGFVLAPLPKEVQTLLSKFPDLKKTFIQIGINKMSDLNKLKNTTFFLPGIAKETGIAGGVSVPLSTLSNKQKLNLPSNVVFVKAGDFLDYNISLTISDDGTPEQKITTVVGKPIDLAIKVDKPAKSIRGYLTVMDLGREQAKRSVPANSQLAAPIMAVMNLSPISPENVTVEQKIVLDSFEYADPDNDGIYTAHINAPLVHGQYEIISIVEYKDSVLAKKELRLTAVIDPEGYVYEEKGNKELRIPDAIVTLLWQNPDGKTFERWPAKDFQQANPQKTDKSGSYSFLVPEGEYKLTVSAPDYYSFESFVFTVEEGRIVHENIALKPKRWWRTLFGLH